jgi:hypothetical protein
MKDENTRAQRNRHPQQKKKREKREERRLSHRCEDEAQNKMGGGIDSRLPLHTHTHTSKHTCSKKKK